MHSFGRISIVLRTFSCNLWVTNIGQRKTLMLDVSAVWWVITFDIYCMINLWAFSEVYGLWIFMLIIFWPLKSFEFVTFESCIEYSFQLVWMKLLFSTHFSVDFFTICRCQNLTSSLAKGMKFSLSLVKQSWREATHRLSRFSCCSPWANAHIIHI